MKVEVFSRSEQSFYNYDYRDRLEISINGDVVFHVSDGEPKDANLSRDFNSCFDIPELMKLAYEAGKRGEDFTVTYEEL